MLNLLDIAKMNKFKFSLTDDEYWFEYSYSIKIMYVINLDDLDQIVEPTAIEKKTIDNIFFNGECLQLLDIKPNWMKISAQYFSKNIIKQKQKC